MQKEGKRQSVQYQSFLSKFFKRKYSEIGNNQLLINLLLIFIFIGRDGIVGFVYCLFLMSKIVLQLFRIE